MKNVVALREEVRKHVLPFYEKNDPAHRINHADEVCSLALEMADAKGGDREILIIAAYFHDKHTADRKNHHILAYEDLTKNEKLYMDMFGVDSYTIQKAANCCFEHRSSRVGRTSSFESTIIKAADTGYPPTTLEGCFKRSFLYHRHTTDRLLAITAAVNHVKEKYGRNYTNKFYVEFFEEAVNKRKEILRNVKLTDFSAEMLAQWETEL